MLDGWTRRDDRLLSPRYDTDVPWL